jgi:AcrR family transcriptional regulator
MGKREANKTEKRQRLLEHGAQLFLEKGFEGTSIEQVISSVGIARGTFYLYFQDKEELFSAIISDIFEPIIAILDETLSDLRLDGANINAQQIRYIRTAIELATVLEEKKNVLLIPFREAWSSNAAGIVLRAWRDKIDRKGVEIVLETQRLKLFRETDPELFVWSVTGAIDRVVWAWLHQETSVSRRDIAQQLADLFWKGVQYHKA